MITTAITQMMTIPCQVDHTEPGPADAYGDHPPAVISSTNEHCWLAQSTRGEENQVEWERWNIYFPPTVVLDANDAVHIYGVTYYVLGNPWTVHDPLTVRPSHIEAMVIRRI
jgi:hypothetical protein